MQARQPNQVGEVNQLKICIAYFDESGDSCLKIMDELQQLKKELPGVKQNVLLKSHTTFKIGGPARYFFVAKTSKDIEKAVKVAKKLGLRLLFLSGGSNVLIADEGFSGLAVKIQNTEYQIKNT